MHRRTFGLFAAATLLAGPGLIGSGRSARAAGDVVRIGWLRGPNDVTLAKARGSLEKALAAQGATVEWSGPFPAAAPAVEAMNAGAIDITVGSSTSCIASFAAGVPMVIFAYQKMAPAAEGILVKRESSIQTVKDLAGRSVAVNRGGTGEYLLVRALERAGMDPKSVTRTYLSPSDGGPAFTSGHVDAWATWDPFLAIAVKSYDARILADGAAIGSDNAVTTMATKAFATEKRALLRVVFDTLQADNAWAAEHKQEAGLIWTQVMGVPTDLAEEIGRNNAVPTRAVTTADVTQIGRIADWYAANGIVPRRPNVEDGVLKLEN
ncbi:MAG TPA: aliphatic sulfonate ABC transporter substrate-binding protein [Stellaceae bacterium]|nr:aliphatic sulfonate ABC transporter substrate-binding protein [Stellaceae bacterium]